MFLLGLNNEFFYNLHTNWELQFSPIHILQKIISPLSKFKLGTYPTVFGNISFQHCWHIFKIYNDQTLHRVLIVVFLGKLFKFMQVIFSKRFFIWNWNKSKTSGDYRAPWISTRIEKYREMFCFVRWFYACKSFIWSFFLNET